MPGNREAWEILSVGASQIRFAGMGGAIGFDMTALKLIAEDYGIQTSPAFWAKVRAVENCIVKKSNHAEKELKK